MEPATTQSRYVYRSRNEADWDDLRARLVIGDRVLQYDTTDESAPGWCVMICEADEYGHPSLSPAEPINDGALGEDASDADLWHREFSV